MEVKLFEIRDEGTAIPVMAIKLSSRGEQERYLLSRAGYGLAPNDHLEYVLMARMAGGSGKMTCDPYEWGNRTLATAHSYIRTNWHTLESGAVVDVQYIMGETTEPKVSENDGIY